MRRFGFNCDSLCSAFGFFVYLMMFYAIGYVIFLFIFLPQELKFTVTDASLTKFNYISTPNNTLHYSLGLNITIRNPNKRIGIYFRRVQIIPHYQKKRFSFVTLNSLAPFYLGHKNTTVLAANSIRGQQLLLLKEKDVKQYDSETILGVYSIDVKVAIRVRVKYGKFKSIPFNPRKIECKLKIPLSSSNGTTVNGYGFRATMCRNVYIVTRRSDNY